MRRSAHRRADVQPSVLALTNRERMRWMLQTTWRDNRVVDGVVVQNMSASPSFFASTTILIIGGLLAVLSSTERASELVRDIPFAARTSVLVFDLKVVLLLAIFVYAFFRFTWSLRQYTFGALIVGAAPELVTVQGRRPARGLCRPRRPRDGPGRRHLQRRPARLLHELRRGGLVLLGLGLDGRDAGRGRWCCTGANSTPTC